VTSADRRRPGTAREAGFTLLEVMVAFMILAIVLTAMNTVHVEAVRKGAIAVDYREAREGADTVFRKIVYEIDKPAWPDGRTFTFDDEYGALLGLKPHVRDRWRAFRGVLRKQPRMAAGSDPTGRTPGLVDTQDRREEERREAREGDDEASRTGEEVYLVSLDVFLGEEAQAPFLTLSTYVPMPESERTVPPAGGGR
jgi:prepilin-type N-terminal cleavage/methylation domain-containing protein